MTLAPVHPAHLAVSNAFATLQLPPTADHDQHIEIFARRHPAPEQATTT